MNRLLLSACTLAILLGTTPRCLAAPAVPSPAASLQRSNVLFILVDDLKPVLGSYGHPHAITPNIDRLARTGTTFLNAHTQQALCGPSRASMLTGLYPDTLGIYGMGGGRYKLREMHPDILTLPQHFKNHGYTTVGIGKVFDPRNVEGSYSGAQDAVSWTAFPGTRGVIYQTPDGQPPIAGHYHNPAQRDIIARLEAEGRAQGLAEKELEAYVRTRGGWPMMESYDAPDEAHLDAAMTTLALAQIDKLQKTESPFFLALGFRKPHLPFVAPKKYWDLYDRASLEIAVAQDYPAGAPEVARMKSGMEGLTYSGLPPAGPASPEVQREIIHGYLACVSFIDAQVGRLLDKLDASGLRENTVVVFWGDHGFHLGDKGLWGKRTTYEQATRVPLIIAPPRVSSGSASAAPVNSIDIFPTLGELAGLDTPPGLDGRSLLPILRDPAASVRPYAASYIPMNGHHGVAIRTGRYRHVAWYKGKPDPARHGIRLADTPEFFELYDYETDPHETKNLAGDTAHAALGAELAALNREHVAYTQGRQFRTGK